MVEYPTSYPIPLVAYTKETDTQSQKGLKGALLSQASDALSMRLIASTEEGIGLSIRRSIGARGVEAAKFLLQEYIMQNFGLGLDPKVVDMRGVLREYLESPAKGLQSIETDSVSTKAKRRESRRDIRVNQKEMVDACVGSSYRIVDFVQAAHDIGQNGIDALRIVFANNPNLNAFDLAILGEPLGLAYKSDISIALTLLNLRDVRFPNAQELSLRTRFMPEIDRRKLAGKTANDRTSRLIALEIGKRDKKDPSAIMIDVTSGDKVHGLDLDSSQQVGVFDFNTAFGAARFLSEMIVENPLEEVVKGGKDANMFIVESDFEIGNQRTTLGWELVQRLVLGIADQRGIKYKDIVEQIFIMFPTGVPVYFCCRKGDNQKLSEAVLKDHLKQSIAEVVQQNRGKLPSNREFKTVSYRDMGDYVELLIGDSIPDKTVDIKLNSYRNRVKAGTSALGGSGVVALIKDESLIEAGFESITYRTERKRSVTIVTYRIMGNLYEGIIDREGYLHLPMGLSQKAAETIELVTLSHLMDIKNPKGKNITEGVADAKIEARARGAVSSRPYLRSEQFGFIPNIDEVVTQKEIRFTRDELTANDFDGCSLVELNRVLVRCLMDNKYLDSLGQSQPELASRISEKVKLIISRIDAKGVGATWQEAQDGSKTLVMDQKTKDTLVGRIGDQDQHQEKIRGFLDRIGLSSEEIRQYFELNIPYFFVNYVEESNPENSSKPIQVVCANAGKRLFEESV